MLLELNQRTGMNHHKVDIFRSGCFCVSTGFLSAALAVLQINGCVEARLGYQCFGCKARENLLAFRSIHISNQPIEGRCDKQMAVFRRHLILIHLCDCRPQCCQYGCTIRKIRRVGFRNTTLARIARKAKRI